MKPEEIRDLPKTAFQQEFEPYSDFYTAQEIIDIFLEHFKMPDCKGLEHIIYATEVAVPSNQAELRQNIPGTLPDGEELYIKENGHPDDPSVYPCVVFEPYENGYVCTDILCFRP